MEIESFMEILKTPTYNLIRNYNEKIEFYTKNKNNEDIDEFHKYSEQQENSLGVWGGLSLLFVMVIFINVFIEFLVLWFIINKRKDLSEQMFILCIILWIVSWWIPFLPIVLIILLLIYGKKM
jgi:hypothetical protein